MLGGSCLLINPGFVYGGISYPKNHKELMFGISENLLSKKNKQSWKFSKKHSKTLVSNLSFFHSTPFCLVASFKASRHEERSSSENQRCPSSEVAFKDQKTSLDQFCFHQIMESKSKKWKKQFEIQCFMLPDSNF